MPHAPGDIKIVIVGEIISESWARSNRYTRARSSESAIFANSLSEGPDRDRISINQGCRMSAHNRVRFDECIAAGRELFRVPNIILVAVGDVLEAHICQSAKEIFDVT
jgi:hypothetical protein